MKLREKNITVEDLLFVFNVKRTPTKPGNPRGQLSTYYLSASKNYYMFSGSVVLDKDWDSARGLLIINGEWIPQDFNPTYFPLANKFSLGKIIDFLLLLWISFITSFSKNHFYLYFRYVSKY